MNWRCQIWGIGAIALSIGLLTPVFVGTKATDLVVESDDQAQKVTTQPESKKTSLSIEQIRQKAESITVKVLANETWGSGILIHKEGEVYTVVTNYHVLGFSPKKSYQIETPDSQIHPAQFIRTLQFGNNDLGLLTFRSAKEYSTIALTPLSPSIAGDKVFAAGFPVEADSKRNRGFIFTDGTIAMLSDKSFEGGYQIGYTNNVQKGMSGGPLLNRQGKLIGINGIHKYPIWDNPYVFQDGTVASERMQQQMIQLSWAIPVETLLKLAPNLASHEDESSK